MSASTEPEIPVEKPDPEVAKPSSTGGEAWPGFDLGGSKDRADGELPADGSVDDADLGAGCATGGGELTGAEGVKG